MELIDVFYWILKHLIILAVSLIMMALYTIYYEYKDSLVNDTTHEIYTENEYYKKEKENKEEIELSFLVPCYKETKRFPKMFEKTLKVSKII